MARWQAILGLALVGLCAVAQVGAIELATIHTHKMGEWKEGSDFVFLHTCFGIIPIRLFRENAPELTRRIYELAEKGNCARCTFYRAEARREKGKEGPPYGLLQGHLDLGWQAIREGNLVTKPGYVAAIPESEEFFISLDDHTSWGTAHVVWGEVLDWFSTDMIAAQDYHEHKHASGTVMRMLNDEFTFRLSTTQASQVATA